MRTATALISALLLGSAPAASTSLPIQMVSVDLASYRFTPSALHLAAGRPVELRITNSSGKVHDFTSKPFFAMARIIRGPVGHGKVTLDPGATATITLIPARGTYKVRCSRPFHTMLGMTESIVVD